MIQNLTKHLMADHYRSSIKKVVINDDTEVTNFKTSMDGNIVNVQFEVPTGVKEIKRLRLYKTGTSDDSLLTDCSLYVPIASETVFRYKCEVR